MGREKRKKGREGRGQITADGEGMRQHTRGFSQILPGRSRRGPVSEAAVSVCTPGRERSRAGICYTESSVVLSLLNKG